MNQRNQQEAHHLCLEIGGPKAVASLQ